MTCIEKVEMILNNLGDILYIVHALESVNTSICITDARHEVIYESTSKDYSNNTTLDDMKKIVESLQHSQEATFKILTMDHWVTAVTTVPITIKDQLYKMELKQYISRIYRYNEDSHNFENLSIHQMKEMVITDALTKLYNRRYIDERLPIDMQSSFELDEPISVLFIDIDYFKNINDTFGHAAGDQILQEMAALLQRQFSKGNGWAARYGGDEMLICLPGCSKRGARRVANRLRKTIGSNSFHVDGEETAITCSIGVHTAVRDSGINSIEELLIMADKNLYRAKKDGRNKVI